MDLAFGLWFDHYNHLEGWEAGVGDHGEAEHVHVPRHGDRGPVLRRQLRHGVGAWDRVSKY